MCQGVPRGYQGVPQGCEKVQKAQNPRPRAGPCKISAWEALMSQKSMAGVGSCALCTPSRQRVLDRAPVGHREVGREPVERRPRGKPD